MKLNESIRSAFIEAVLQDTPKIDYMEQRKKLIQDWLIEKAPANIVRAWKDKTTNVYFRPDSIWYDYKRDLTGWLSLGKYWLVPEIDVDKTYKITDRALLEKLHAIDEADGAQTKQRDEIKTKLKATIYAFNTVKQARDALPEFSKYLPDPEEPKCRTLPAITDLVHDLMKAGWPKAVAEAKAKAQQTKQKKGTKP